MEANLIGKKIAEARKKSNLSQAQLAQNLFISPQAVGKWERGESMPDITTFIRLAEIFGVDLNYFSDNFQSTISENTLKSNREISKIETNKTKLKSKLRWDMSYSNWIDSDFSGLKNLAEKFSSSNMHNCLFVSSDLSELNLTRSNIYSCDFSNSQINKSNIQSSSLVNNQFSECNLNEAKFVKCEIKECNFSNADLTKTTFESTDFRKNNLTNAIFNQTAFIKSLISDVVLEDNLVDCYFEKCEFKKVIFKNAVIKNTFFKHNILKGIEFIDCEVDRLTYGFLKSGKANLKGITIID